MKGHLTIKWIIPEHPLANIIKLLLLCLTFYASTAAADSHIDIDAEASFGFDSNIYRAPSSAYTDYAKSTQPEVDPEVVSGSFVPAELDIEYMFGGGSNRVVTNYRFDGRFYTDSAYSSANEYDHDVAVGNQYIFNRSGIYKDSVYIGAVAGLTHRRYVDRDNGSEQIFGDADVSQRYSYRESGLEFELKKRSGQIQYRIDADYRLRDYDDPVTISEYDHTYTRLRGAVDYKWSYQTKVGLEYRYYVYDYNERPARNELGQLFSSNPALKYSYNVIKASLRQRFTKQLTTYLDLENKQRTDHYVNYHDYDKTELKLRALFDWSKTTTFRFSMELWERDYPNAFAFDHLAAGIPKKSFDGNDFEFSMETAWSKNSAVVAEIAYTDENSTDLRYQYDRIQSFIGIKWHY